MSFQQALRWMRIGTVSAALVAIPISMSGPGVWSNAVADELPTEGDGGCHNSTEGHCAYTNENGGTSFRLGAYCSWYRPDCETCCSKQNSICEGQNGFTSDWGQCG